LLLNTPEPLDNTADDENTIVDGLDEDLTVDDGHFYDEVLEDV
jgi:hypothetical protein